MQIRKTRVSGAGAFRTAVTEGLKNAVLEMLGSMAMAEVTYIGEKETEGFSVSGPVTGLMVLVGEYRAIVAVCMSEQLLRSLVADITGGNPSALTGQDLGDGIGEMVNMICGGMKTTLGDMDIELLPPMAILGGGYSANWNTDQKTIVLEFEKDSAEFTVYACEL